MMTWRKDNAVVSSIQKTIVWPFALYVALVIGAIWFGSGKAHADMCGPSNLPVLSSLNPYVKGCQVWVPFTGNLPQVPVPVNPGTALAPIPGFGGGGGWLGPQPPNGYTPFP